MEIKEKYNYNKIKMEKKEYKPNHDTLVTFGEEAYTTVSYTHLTLPTTPYV